MSKKEEQAEKLKGFANLLKSSPAKQPIQEVRPVEPIRNTTEDSKEPMRQLNVLIPERLLKAAKQRSVATDIPLKDLISQALEQYLENE